MSERNMDMNDQYPIDLDDAFDALIVAVLAAGLTIESKSRVDATISASASFKTPVSQTAYLEYKITNYRDRAVHTHHTLRLNGTNWLTRRAAKQAAKKVDDTLYKWVHLKCGIPIR